MRNLAQAAKALTGKKEPVRFIACITDEVTREAVGRAATSLGWTDAKVRPGGIAIAPHEVDPKNPPRLLLVDITDSPDAPQEVRDLMEVCGPGTRLIAIGATNDVTLFRSLMAIGVADYLVKPVSSELVSEALSRAIDDNPVAAGAVGAKTLHAFIGARGGVGTTTLAVAAAWLLHHEHKSKTALMDLDLHFGTLALSLDLEPGRGLREALEHPERTDNLLLASAMVKEGDQLPILAAEEPLDEELHFDPDAATTLLDALFQDYDTVVVDIPRSLDGVSRHVLSLADNIAIVTDLSLASLRDSLRLIELAKRVGHAKPILIANQVGAIHRGEIGRAEFERGLGTPLDVAVPFDAKAAVAMARGGKAMPAAAATSKAVIELRTLTARLTGREIKARGGLRRWLG